MLNLGALHIWYQSQVEIFFMGNGLCS